MKQTLYYMIMGLAFFSSLDGLSATQNVPAKKNSYLPPLSASIDEILKTNSVAQNHILLVSVSNAVPAEVMREFSAYVKDQWQIRAVVTNAPKPSDVALLLDRKNVVKAATDKSKLRIEIISEPDQPLFVAIPGIYCRVNVYGLAQDKPNEAFLKKRRFQRMLQGIALSCGIGWNMDDYCVMFYQAEMNEGLDKSSATFSPFAYVPLRQKLFNLCGDEIFDTQ
jgi:hypothetical protein